MTSALFSSLPLAPAMLANIAELGFETMTPIQAESLPVILAGQDVIAQAKTGSGKTAAFGIGLLSHLNQRFFGAQGLILCPTRELADQVAKELRRLARYADNIKILTLCGGVSMGPQLASLEQGAHIVVGTPGRVLKHLQKGSLVLDGLKTLVLDEADRMLDMGFHDSIVDVVKQAPAKRQTLLFSATYPDGIKSLSARFQSNPITVTVESLHADTQIEQLFFEVSDNERSQALAALLHHYQPTSAVLFCNTKLGCDNTANALRTYGFYVLALHGDLEQRDRDQVLVQFANQSCPLLVATDVAARGLDIKDLTAVINVELSFDPEVHIHRIGRTGRAGQTGMALSLCSPAEVTRANAIEDYQKQPVVWHALPTINPKAKIPAAKMVTLNISGGRKDKLRPGDILGALTGDAGIPGTHVGKIDIFDTQAFVAIDRTVADEAQRQLAKGKIKGRVFKIRRLIPALNQN